jgi:hypothetical protein
MLLSLNLNLQRIRWLVMVIISVVGLVSATIDQNAMPLLVVLFALIFLAAPLMKKVQHPHKVIVRRIGLATVIVMFGVGAFNYVVNPFGLYPPHLFEALVLTTRDHKMNLYAAYSPPPQALIFGSSRSFTVDPTQIEDLWHYTAFNASLTGGLMRDSLAFLRYISEVGKFPKLLIINVAPEVLLWSDGYRYAQEPDARLWNYIDYQDPLYPIKDSAYRMIRLLSKEQLEASLRVLQTKGIDRKTLYGYRFDTNGMGHFSGTKLSADDLDPDKLMYTNWGKMFAEYHPHLYELDVLQHILEMAQQQHMVVIGYMPPYHPVLRDVLETRTEFKANVNYIMSQLDIFEKEYPFYYISFIDSELFSNGDEMFYDIIHPTEQASALMMQQLYDQFHGYAGSS